MRSLLSLLVALTACSAPADSAQQTGSNETPPDEAPPNEMERPEPVPATLTAAEQRAQAVAAYAGDPYAVTALAFTFAVVEGQQTRVSRQHIWCPGEGLAQVTTAESTTLTDLRAPEEDSPAYGHFINDSFWLLAPSKVTDGGVSVGLENNDLTLAFNEVGLTPGDRYWLTLTPEHRVEAWRFELEGGQTGAFTFLEEQVFGPLRISTVRRDPDGREVRFTEVAILDTCPLHR